MKKLKFYTTEEVFNKAGTPAFQKAYLKESKKLEKRALRKKSE